MGAFEKLEALALKHFQDGCPVMDGFKNILGEGVDTVLENLGLQMHLNRGGAGDLEPGGDMLVKLQIEGLGGGDFLLVQQVEDEISAGVQPGKNIGEDLLHIGGVRDVVDGIAGAGDEVKLRPGGIGEHIRHVEGDVRVCFPGNGDHAA